jgi:hypothetical protein
MSEKEAAAAANPRAGAVVDNVFGVEGGEAEAGEHIRQVGVAVLASGGHHCCDSCDGATACASATAMHSPCRQVAPRSEVQDVSGHLCGQSPKAALVVGALAAVAVMGLR